MDDIFGTNNIDNYASNLICLSFIRSVTYFEYVCDLLRNLSIGRLIH